MLIWESTLLMTLIDLAIGAVALASLWIMFHYRRQLTRARLLKGSSFAVLGLSIIALFYLADLIIMWVLPRFIGPERAMSSMRTLHLEYSWVTMTVAVLCLFTGFAVTFRGLLAQADGLAEANSRLSSLYRHIVQLREAERSQLARELHDQIGQSLTAVKLSLGVLRKGELDNSKLDLHIDNVADAIEQIRNFSIDLRPSVLDDLGLAPALGWLVDRLAQQAGFEGEVIADETDRLPTEIEVTCFRIAQEALTNTVRYAGADRVMVELHRSSSEVELVIEDDGSGFDVEAALSRAKAGASMGLLGMQERLHLAGGSLTIDSRVGEGTEVRARLPLSA